jgi:putative FmdB family regulatory protein
VPLYEYRCNECDRRFSLLVGMTAKKPKRQCPRCGSRKATKLISRIAPIVRESDSGDDFDDMGDDFDDEYGDLDDDFED